MKPFITKTIFLCTLLCITIINCYATIIDWKGGTSSSWNLAANWSPAQVPTVDDDVRIGVVIYALNGAQPTLPFAAGLAGVKACKTLTFGTAVNPMTLTVDGTLNVTGLILQNPAGGLLSNGLQTTTLAGSGKITCASIQAGTTTGPLSVVATNLMQVVSTVATLEISGDVNVYSTSVALVLGVAVNNAIFSLRGGNATIGGQIYTKATGYLLFPPPSSAKFSIELTGSASSSLKLTNSIPIAAGTIAASIDFYNPGTGTGTTTVEYAGSGQTVYSGSEAMLDHTPTTYQNIKFSSTGTKIAQAGAILATGNWLSDGNSTGPVINLTANNATATITGSLLGSGGIIQQGNGDVIINGTTLQNTGGVFTLGTGAFTFNGTTFTNTGTFTCGTGKLTFGRSGAASLSTTTPITFRNVDFVNGNTKTLTSGSFLVASTGLLTVSGSTTLAAGGNLTLISDTLSSASVAPVLGASAVTGNVNVQRSVKGSPTSLNKRGYRFISSPVYTAQLAADANVLITSKVYDMSYLLNSVYVSGASGGGFNAPTGTNPSLLLLREDVPVVTTSFTGGNFKGVTKINNTNLYDIGTQKRLTSTNTADTTVRIPIGNGVSFFFRGDKTDNTTQGGTKVTLPFDYPEDVVLTQIGTLNTGTVNVRLWFKRAEGLSYSVIDTPASGATPAKNNTKLRGFCLLGNPYASTINFEKFNRNGTSSTLYGENFPAASATQGKIWVYNATTKQYDSYMQKAGSVSAADTTTGINPGTATGAASNMIASGQGFMIKATASNQKFSFREGAKTTTQAGFTNLNKIMSVPRLAEVAADDSNAPEPLLRLKLTKDSLNTDDVAMLFNQSASSNFSDNEDAEDLGGNGALVSLSVLSADSVLQAISKQPLPGIRQTEIPLLVSAVTSGIYNLKLSNPSNLPDFYEIWLKDKFTGDSLDIRHNLTYNFNLYREDAASYGNERFKLVIRQNPILVLQSLELKANKVNAASQLNWKTNSAFNFTNYSVERSTNGTDYKQIGSISSNEKKSYSYTDLSPARGKNYYRLMVERTDNKTFYTKEVTVDYPETYPLSPDDKLVVYPNPVVNNAYMAVKDDDKVRKKYIINIMNTSGTVVKTLTSSTTEWQYNTSELIPGTYVVQAVDSQTKKIAGSSKFIKQ